MQRVFRNNLGCDVFLGPQIPRSWGKEAVTRSVIPPPFPFCAPQIMVKTRAREQCPQMLAAQRSFIFALQI